MNLALNGTRRFAAGVATLAIVLSACTAAATPAPTAAPATASPAASASQAAATSAPATKAPCGTVNIAVNPWVGYEANAAVVAYLLKNELGCTVVLKNITEQVSWRASRPAKSTPSSRTGATRTSPRSTSQPTRWPRTPG